MNFTKLPYTVSLLIVGLGLAVNGYSQPDQRFSFSPSFLTNGLVAYYPFNGNANDASGNGRNGTVEGATLTADRFGIPNSAYSFNGTSWIQLPDAILPVSPTACTVSAWVLVHGTPPYTDEQEVFHTTPRIGEIDMSISSAGQVGFGVKTGNAWTPPEYSSTTIPTTWAQLVGVYQQGQQIECWLNGSLVQTTAAPTGTLTTNSTDMNTTIGIYDYTAGPYNGFVGSIDDVRIYNRAFSTNEVQQLYAYESQQPIVALKKAVKPSFSNLYLGTNYQLQVSTDLTTWTNNGSPFTPTNSVMDYPQYFDVDNWNSLFFRVQATDRLPPGVLPP